MKIFLPLFIIISLSIFFSTAYAGTCGFSKVVKLQTYSSKNGPISFKRPSVLKPLTFTMGRGTGFMNFDDRFSIDSKVVYSPIMSVSKRVIPSSQIEKRIVSDTSDRKRRNGSIRKARYKLVEKFKSNSMKAYLLKNIRSADRISYTAYIPSSTNFLSVSFSLPRKLVKQGACLNELNTMVKNILKSVTR